MDLMISFPFPKEASEVVQGDYADTEIAMDISIDNIISQLERRTGRKIELPEIGPVPAIPGDPKLPETPDLPDPGGLVGRGGGLLEGGLG